MRGTSKVTIALVVVIATVIMWGELVTRASAQQRPARRGAASVEAALQPAAQRTSESGSERNSDAAPQKRLREGATLVEQLGTFKATGDHVLFQMKSSRDSLHVLENLALERIWNMYDDTRGRVWTVSGTVTEYRGRNYLLIQRAVLTTNATSTNATSTATP